MRRWQMSTCGSCPRDALLPFSHPFYPVQVHEVVYFADGSRGRQRGIARHTLAAAALQQQQQCQDKTAFSTGPLHHPVSQHCSLAAGERERESKQASKQGKERELGTGGKSWEQHGFG